MERFKGFTICVAPQCHSPSQLMEFFPNTTMVPKQILTIALRFLLEKQMQMTCIDDDLDVSYDGRFGEILVLNSDDLWFYEIKGDLCFLKVDKIDRNARDFRDVL